MPISNFTSMAMSENSLFTSTRPSSLDKQHVCEICQQIFPDEFSLCFHVENHQNDAPKPYACNICGELFTETVTSENHSCDHFEEDDYVCEFCGEDFDGFANLKAHNCLKHNQKNSCKVCKEDFPTPDDIKNHSCNVVEANLSTVLTGLEDIFCVSKKKEQFECKICYQTFTSVEALSSHPCKNEYRGLVSCETCGEALRSNGFMQSHVCNKAVKPKPAACGLCRKTFTSIEALSKHNCIATDDNTYSKTKNVCTTLPVKNNSIVDEVSCNKCERRFLSNSDLQGHACSKPVVVKRRLCGECGKTFLSSHRCEPMASNCKECGQHFTTNAALGKHVKANKGVTLFTCPSCPKTFRLDCGLRIHVQSHEKKDPYYCSKCHRVFEKQKLYQLHLLSHDEDRKKWICRVCGLNFPFERQLRRHLLIHNVNPYECDTCGATFTQQHSLKVHTARHTGDLPYICGYCGMGFATKSRLRYHLMTHTCTLQK